MSAEDHHRWKEPPPPRPRRRNAVFLRLFDGPARRDWLVWWTAGWTVFFFLVILGAPEPRASTLPPVVDALLAAALMGFLLLGVLPAFLRLQVRRLVWKRRERRFADTRREQTGDLSAPTARLPVIRGGATPSQSFPQTPGPPRSPGPQPRPGSSGTDPRPPEGQTDPGPPPVPSAPPPTERPASRKRSDETTAGSNGLDGSDVFGQARKLQYPVARAIRSLQSAPTSMDRYQALLDAADELCIVVGATGAAWLNASRADPAALSELVTAYDRGVSQGTWVSVAQKAAKAAAADGDDLGLGAFARKPTKAQLAQLSVLTQERNKAAHGMRPRTQAQAAQRLETLVPALETALRGAQYLSGLPWILTTSSSYRSRDRVFDVTAGLVMGDHPEFEPTRLAVARPLENDRVYLAPDGSDPIDMTPFIVVRNCEVCRSPELFHSDRRVEKGGTILKNAAGHGGPLTDNSLDDDFRGLAEVTS